jgi:hypothetical protein
VSNKKIKKQKIKKTRNRFGVIVKQDKTFAVVFFILMGFFVVFCIWMLYVTIKRQFYEGALLDNIHKFHNLESQVLLEVLLFPLRIIVPLCLLFIFIYLIKKVLGNYFFNKGYYIIFSNSGIRMAGHFTSWNSLMWIGGKKNFFNGKMYLCWAIKHSHSGQTCFEIPAIQPFSEAFFFTICKKITATFPNEVAHLSKKSWKVNFSDIDGMAKKQTLIPWSSSAEIDCEILQETVDCKK